MPPILIEQAAAAMVLSQDELAGLLSHCGMRPTGGVLSPSDVAVLRRFLEERQTQSRLLAESCLPGLRAGTRCCWTPAPCRTPPSPV